ncbi:holin family HP1 protein [Azomonas agilis]|uniref:Holin family HP1 protein n=1 Tax=Azomonas agilis TaxID=116849 RepID=A0A562HYZ7_9GAMM|nr:HP1 family phage holin [Azomonas agilis]TWH63892.1 holin family HP1 protein [Azomonas agilis]
MLPEKLPSTLSYGGGALSILSAMTLTDWGILVGILTAIGTYLVNHYFRWRCSRQDYYFKLRRDQREQELHDLKKQQLKGEVSP